MLRDGESTPLVPKSVWVEVEILEVVEAGLEWSVALASLLLLPLHAEEVVEAVLLVNAVAQLEAELLVQLLAPPTP